MITDDQRAFFNGYVTAMLWANTLTDTGAETVPVDATAERGDLAWSAVRELWRVSDSFFHVMAVELYMASFRRSWEELGHDLALNHNGHGEGFWSRNLGPVGQWLSYEANNYGEHHLFSDGAQITPL